MSGADPEARRDGLGDRALRNAYADTEYRIGCGSRIVAVRVGEASTALDALLEHERAVSGIVITAANPDGALSGTDANRRFNERLAAELDVIGCRFLPHLAVASRPEWNEPGFFALDLSPGPALALAKAYRQYAILLCPIHGRPSLLFTRLMTSA